jgi:cell wall-associated NlpC family hydrolase
VRPSSSTVGADVGARLGLAPYVLVGVLVALVLATRASATGPLDEKRAEAQQVYNQIQQLDASLSLADERLNLANIRLAAVRHDIAVNRHELHVAKLNLQRSQIAIAKRLVTLYTTPQTSTLEIILGASSLDDMLTRVDTQNRVSKLDGEVLDQVTTFKLDVKRHARALAKANAATRHLVAQRRAEEQSIADQLGQRRALLNSINGEIARIEAQIAAEAQARALQAAQAARARVAAAQSATEEHYTSSVIGASAATPEGATVVPTSGYSGAVGVAMSEIGTPYVWAGASPGGFDCSGLVMYAYSKMGVSLPHSSYAMWNDGVSVPRDQLEPGDLVFFDGLGHVGMYVGNDQFVHAPHTGTTVQVSSLDSGYGSSYVGARRILNG